MFVEGLVHPDYAKLWELAGYDIVLLCKTDAEAKEAKLELPEGTIDETHVWIKIFLDQDVESVMQSPLFVVSELMERDNRKALEELANASVDVIKTAANTALNCKAEPNKFFNHYRCSECGTEWQDPSPYMNNDRCPNCDAEIEPSFSEPMTEKA